MPLTTKKSLTTKMHYLPKMFFLLDTYYFYSIDFKGEAKKVTKLRQQYVCNINF